MKKLILTLILINSLFAFDVGFIKSITYKLEITKTDGTKGYATAVAISKDAKLVTAYHNINLYKKIVAIDFLNHHFPIKVGKVSPSTDLAFLYLLHNNSNIPYAIYSKNNLKLGNDIYIYNSDEHLFKGIVSQIDSDKMVYNFEINKGTSGAGVFKDNNELVAIALGKDLLDKTSYGVPLSMLNSIKEAYQPKKILTLHDSENYDYSYCEDKEELAIWAKYAKSSNMQTQELHALFLGLCEKVKRHDITTEEAQIIFENSRTRLLGL